VKKYRETIKAYNAGKRDITPKTLEATMRLLEADEVIAAQKAQHVPKKSKRKRRPRQPLPDECEDTREEVEERSRYATRLALERKWMSDWRDAKFRMIARGLRPSWVTPKLIEQAYHTYPDGLPPLTH